MQYILVTFNLLCYLQDQTMFKNTFSVPYLLHLGMQVNQTRTTIPLREEKRFSDFNCIYKLACGQRVLKIDLSAQ